MAFDLTPVVELGSSVAVRQVVVDASGNVDMAGDFAVPANFNPDGAPVVVDSPDVDSFAGFVAEYTPSGVLAWVHLFEPEPGGLADATGLAVVPGTGAIDVVGTAQGPVNFDPGATDLTESTGTSQGFFVASLTPEGSLDSGRVQLLAATPGSFAAIDAVPSLAIDPSGPSLYVTGASSGSFSYGSPSGPAIDSPSGGTAFVLKLDNDLGYEWGESTGQASGVDAASYVAVSQGHVVIGGTDQPFNGGTATFIEELSGSGQQIAFVRFGVVPVQLPDLTFEDTGGDATLHGLATDAAGDVYAAGSYSGDLAKAMGQDIPLDEVGPTGATEQPDAFLIKFDPALGTDWARGLGSLSGEDIGSALAVAGSGDVYLGGAVSGSSTFGPTTGPGVAIAGGHAGPSAFLLEVDGDGNLINATVDAGIGASEVGEVVVGPSGSVMATARITSTAGVEDLLPQYQTQLPSVTVVMGVTPGAPGFAGFLPPVLLGTSRIVEHHRKQVIETLHFNAPLDATVVVNPALYRITRAVGRGRRVRTAIVPTLSVRYDAARDSIRLTIRKTPGKSPAELTATGLEGAIGTPVLPLSTVAS